MVVPSTNVSTMSHFVSLDIWSQMWIRHGVMVPDVNAMFHVLSPPAYLYVDLLRFYVVTVPDITVA